MLAISVEYGGEFGTIMVNDLRGNPQRVNWRRVPDDGTS